jgi:hypothetical protein
MLLDFDGQLRKDGYKKRHVSWIRWVINEHKAEMDQIYDHISLSFDWEPGVRTVPSPS